MQDARIDDRAGAERDQDDVVPARATARKPAMRSRAGSRRDRRTRTARPRAEQALVDEPPRRLIASAAASLNRLKRSLFASRCPAIRSRNSDSTSGPPSGRRRRPARPPPRTGSSPSGFRWKARDPRPACSAARPRWPVGRHGLRRVAAPPDQIEERGRELSDPTPVPCARSGGTSAGARSDGGSCS